MIGWWDSRNMKPKITILTLGVDDLERSVKFYRDGLGLPTKGIVGTQFEHGAVAFFELEAGMKLAVFPRDDLALDAKIDRTPPSSTEFSIGHLVNSKNEVDEGKCCNFENGNGGGRREELGGGVLGR